MGSVMQTLRPVAAALLVLSGMQMQSVASQPAAPPAASSAFSHRTSSLDNAPAPAPSMETIDLPDINDLTDSTQNKSESSCSTVYSIVAGSDEFSILGKAALAVGLQDLLKSSSLAFTIVAPTNDAFMATLSSLDITSEELLSNTDLLRKILLYHITFDAAISADNLSNGTTYSTPVGNQTWTVRASSESDTYRIAAAQSTATIDEVVNACDAYILVVDNVLLPGSLQT